MEGGIVGKAAFLRGARRAHALADQVRGVHQPPLAYIGVHAHAGLSLEQAHEMVTAEEDPVGQRVEHDRFGYGTILSLEGDGPNRKAVVSFDASGQKTLLLMTATSSVGKMCLEQAFVSLLMVSMARLA